ncbi:NUDIX hydrolase [Bacillus sp. DX4.1]|uniref:NUDIX hydrolase n=1 Tax=Bacillus sp. DX4.1 TaxID=3055867 RepID=UPI0025A20CB0|nr:NUDIX hydrolase [Bacillus sp. DX4.1]MDM5189028.1 NUDIX hydrolase [Bacillus sp. DX4.1]
MDLTFKSEKTCFNYRVGAICIQQDKILLLQNEGEDFWYVPGGRVKMLENSESAVKRELKEELGVNIEVKRLLWMVENFFTYDEHDFHEISFYYEVALDELPSEGDKSFILEEDGRQYLFQWIPLEYIGDLEVKPDFLKEKVKQLPVHTKHILTSQLGDV